MIDDVPPVQAEGDAYAALNAAADSDNGIHGAEAAAYGFDGALVPGIALLAYVCESVRRALGDDFTRTGHIAVSYAAPIYDRETVRVRVGGNAEQADIELRSPAGAVAVKGVASLDPSRYSGRRPSLPPLPLPRVPPPLTGANLVAAEVLGGMEVSASREHAQASFERFGLDLAPYAVAGLAPLACVAQTYFPFADANFRRVGPAVLAGSEFAIVRAPRLDEQLSLRGRVDRLFKRNGNQFMTNELVWLDSSGAPCVWGLHTSIYALAKTPMRRLAPL